MQMKGVTFFGVGIWNRVVGIRYSGEWTAFGGIWFGTLTPNTWSTKHHTADAQREEATLHSKIQN